MQKTPKPTALSPHSSATVSASAGTGKTWLLVSRIIRLLLEGTAADAILAITFTRKAAAEMQTRLASRLLEFASCDEDSLIEQLQGIHAPIDPLTINKARWLYEDLLHAPQNVRATTFHAFCQEILRRFPLEADIPPGFDLIDTVAELTATAWDLLNRQVTKEPGSELAANLDLLFDHCGSLYNTQTAVFNFLHHRSDWWSYTEEQHNPVQYASDKLQDILKINPNESPKEIFFQAEIINWLGEFNRLLQLHPTINNSTFADNLTYAAEQLQQKQYDSAYQQVASVFLTQKGEVRSRKTSKTLISKMGESRAERFLEIHISVAAKLLRTNETLKRRKLYYATCAWYNVGQLLLDIFQTLKTEQRLLDFTDLEWKTYRLLNHSESAHWIQYKLDQRIDHLLVDEFQDTNPTQWQLIVPLLDELAAGATSKNRSVFLVGDKKQSIYRFRRASPELFDTAQQWISQRLSGLSESLATSWRSAPAIMQCVNSVFEDGILNEQIHDFQTHRTNHQNLWGHVELLPLLVKQQDVATPDITPATLRNPLLASRIIREDTRHYEEGCLIAAKIKDLISRKPLIGAGADNRPLEYRDIMILVRHRTHTDAYEQALREHDIPYHSAQKGTLLESLEVRDMIALLEVIVAPYNNLALATVLRSPMFACSHQDLMQITQTGTGTWLERLGNLCSNGDSYENSSIKHLMQAHRLLHRWKADAGKIPVHDLLDRIYSEGNLLKRYKAAYPTHLQQRTQANLTRFLELALEVDSGRYPSIGHFLSRINLMRSSEQEGPDEGSIAETESKVRLMTIHGSKGMEAPVVFIADAANSHRPSSAYQALVHWPAKETKPSRFLLTPKVEYLDQLTQEVMRLDLLAQQREEANLLYVAITRARQMLFISGSSSNIEKQGWYGIIYNQLNRKHPQSKNDNTPPCLLQNGQIKYAAKIETPAAPVKQSIAINPALLEKQNASADAVDISPSYTDPLQSLDGEILYYQSNKQTATEEDSQIRGRIIHRILQLLSESKQHEDFLADVAAEFSVSSAKSNLQECLTEALRVFQDPELQWIFNPGYYDKAYNEIPIAYRKNSRVVYGIIDRLILNQDKLIIIDYKSHRINDKQDLDMLTSHYKNQLKLYQDGVQKCWPDKDIHSYLLFTQSATLVEFSLEIAD